MVNATPNQVQRLLELAEAKANLLPEYPRVEAEEDVLMTINTVKHGGPATAHEVGGAIDYLEHLER